MRPSSSPSEPAAPSEPARPDGPAAPGGLFDAVLARGGVAAQVSDAAWLRALLDAEAALARAGAAAGLVPAEAAARIHAACGPSRTTWRRWAATRPRPATRSCRW